MAEFEAQNSGIKGIPVDDWECSAEEALEMEDLRAELDLKVELSTMPSMPPAAPLRTQASHRGPKHGSHPRQQAAASREGKRRGHWSTEENKRYHWFL
jgi:hypothetical protein